MSIASIYHRDVETVGPDASVVEIARRMHDRRVGTVLIVDEERRPMGIVSDRDVTVRVVARQCDPARTPVREIMSPIPTTVLRDVSLETALAAMRGGRIRRLPVTDGAGKLIGIVALDDVLRLISEELREVEELLDSEVPAHASGAGDADRR